ncbi:MAG: hypothetical protein ACK5AZ_23140 [Bryobacteraceae bacterium]
MKVLREASKRPKPKINFPFITLQRSARILGSWYLREPEQPTLSTWPASSGTPGSTPIEAGAADYCAAPFEAVQIQWLLEANLSRTQASAA